MEVPIHTVASLDPKGLSGRGCSKVVVETVKSIPMDDGVCTVTATNAEHAQTYEILSHHDGNKEIDFTMF